ncbi:MAG: hypothetical protein M0O93_07550, partial [Bacteroidales bacterium]|nr:hypothetical protein [Bacteroidales bacterium]
MAKNKTPFKVSDNYFNNLEKDMLSKVNQSPKKKYLFSTNKPIIRYAAAFLLLLAVGGMLWWSQPSDLSDASKQISQSKIIDSVVQKHESSIINEPIVASDEIDNVQKESLQAPKQIEAKQSKDIELSQEELEYLEYY